MQSFSWGAIWGNETSLKLFREEKRSLDLFIQPGRYQQKLSAKVPLLPFEPIFKTFLSSMFRSSCYCSVFFARIFDVYFFLNITSNLESRCHIRRPLHLLASGTSYPPISFLDDYIFGNHKLTTV